MIVPEIIIILMMGFSLGFIAGILYMLIGMVIEK